VHKVIPERKVILVLKERKVISVCKEHKVHKEI
jgi:hypothetical protein